MNPNEILIGGIALSVILAALQGIIYAALEGEFKPLISACIGTGLGLLAMWGIEAAYPAKIILTYAVGGFMGAMTSSGAYSWIKPRGKRGGLI